MLTKTVDARIKATENQGGLESGQFEAIVSVFGNVDSMGDIVQPGAFKNNLQEWEESGSPIPVYWSHRMDDPHMNIGSVMEAKETDEGLLVKAQIDIDTPTGAQVYKLLKGRRVKQFSFAYDVVAGEENTHGGYDLKELKVHEVSVVPVGANQETSLLDVKAAKAGRALSAKNETSLRNAVELLQGVLDSLGPNEDGKAKVEGPVKDEDPVGVKSDVPAQRTPATVRLTIETELVGFGISD